MDGKDEKLLRSCESMDRWKMLKACLKTPTHLKLCLFDIVAVPSSSVAWRTSPKKTVYICLQFPLPLMPSQQLKSTSVGKCRLAENQRDSRGELPPLHLSLHTCQLGRNSLPWVARPWSHPQGAGQHPEFQHEIHWRSSVTSTPIWRDW